MKNISAKYEAVLTALLITSPNIYFENSHIISERLFENYKDIYKAFMKLVENGRHINIDTIVKQMPDSEEKIYEVASQIDYDIPVQELVAELTERYKDNLILQTELKAKSALTADEKAEIYSNMLAQMLDTRDKKAFSTVYEQSRELFKTQNKDGIKTGFGYLDYITGGLQKSDLIVIAAESSMGKTSFGLQIANNICHNPQLFLSLEMSNMQLVARLISQKSKIETKNLHKNITESQSFASDYIDKKFFLSDDSSTNIGKIIGLIRAAKIKYDIQVVTIDYLQLVSDSSQRSREQEVGTVARKLKNIAKELDITVIAISQLSRPKDGKSHYPTMARLRDSGQIEEAADLVIFLYRPEYYGIEAYNDMSTDK